MPKQVCSETDCSNVVPTARIAAGYPYCVDCSKRKPYLLKQRPNVTIDAYDAEELRRAW